MTPNGNGSFDCRLHSACATIQAKCSLLRNAFLGRLQYLMRHQALLLLPILVRLGLLLVVPIVEFTFHKLAHKGIHHATEKVGWLKQMARRWKYLPDALMIVALVILHHVSE
jgi:hypothetical protein